MLEYEIIVDHSETANKCTILPLNYRADFKIMRGNNRRALAAGLLLHPDGIPMQELQSPSLGLRQIAAIDCVWRRLPAILEKIQKPLPMLVKVPHDFVTAYPRASYKDFDPVGGLATIEALFIAAAFLGHWDLSLLREYYFAERFITANTAAFRRYGFNPQVEKSLFQPRYPRNAQTRRLGRGRSAGT